MRFAFIRAEKASFPVAWMCRRLAVSRSGFHAWCRRPASKHKQRDEKLGAKVAVIFAAHNSNYGSPRIGCELRNDGERVGRKRVARLMRERDLVGKRKRCSRKTTDSNHDFSVAPNVVAREFHAAAADRTWVGDITYVNTWEGWLYVAVLLDVFSRRVVGWAVADHMRTELPLEALGKAIASRKPQPGLVHHSDRGCQYASHEYRAMLRRHDVVCSMSRKGNCWDNAVAESFFAMLKTELVDRHAWPRKEHAIDAIAKHITYYNTRRRHSTLGYVSPIEYELAARNGAIAA